MVLKPETFTEQGQEVLASSQEIIRRYNHSQWDVEHILLALLELDNGVPMEVLKLLGLSTDLIKSDLKDVLSKAPKTTYDSAQIYVTPSPQTFLGNAKAEADRFKDEFIGAEHMLIATNRCAMETFQKYSNLMVLIKRKFIKHSQKYVEATKLQIHARKAGTNH